MCECVSMCMHACGGQGTSSESISVFQFLHPCILKAVLSLIFLGLCYMTNKLNFCPLQSRVLCSRDFCQPSICSVFFEPTTPRTTISISYLTHTFPPLWFYLRNCPFSLSFFSGPNLCPSFVMLPFDLGSHGDLVLL